MSNWHTPYKIKVKYSDHYYHLDFSNLFHIVGEDQATLFEYDEKRLVSFLISHICREIRNDKNRVLLFHDLEITNGNFIDFEKIKRLCLVSTFNAFYSTKKPRKFITQWIRGYVVDGFYSIKKSNQLDDMTSWSQIGIMDFNVEEFIPTKDEAVMKKLSGKDIEIVSVKNLLKDMNDLAAEYGIKPVS